MIGTRMQRAWRTFAVAVSVLGYAAIGPMGYVPFALMCWWWRRQPRIAAMRLQSCIQNGFRFSVWWLRLLGIADCRSDGVTAALPDGPCVVVCNHPTQLDVLAVTACLGRASTIVKPSVFNRLLIRPMLRGAGLLEGPGRDPVSIGRVIDDGVRCLGEGMRIYVFPEGTRSEPDRLQPFGRVAFEIACRADVPVVVLGARCTPVYLSREVPLFRPPHPMARHRLTLLAVEQPATFGHDSRRMCATVRTRIDDWYFDREHRAQSNSPADASAPCDDQTVG